MYKEENLYFIAIIPPGNICNEINQFKEDFALRFASKTALKIIPHITVKAPFRLPLSGHPKLLQWFQQLPVNHESFNIELRNFGAFHHRYNPVVFVHPVMQKPLDILQKKVISSFKVAFPTITVMEVEMKYNPHITIAYRDLESSMFSEAWKEYKIKNYQSVFEVNNLYLLQHDKKKWNVINTYPLLN